MPEAELLLVNANELATPAGPGPLRGRRLGAVRTLEDGAIAFREGRVAAVGTTEELAGWDAARVVDCSGRTVVPGFVDAHTHLVWAGDRVAELVRKLEGASYEEILASGGGIHQTVRDTRAAGFEALVASASARLDRCLAQGTTTMEAKSGYALDLDGELEMLRVVEALAGHAVELVPTLLGAHAVPQDVEQGGSSSRQAFVDMVCDELTPRAAKEGLAVFCDAFVDEGAFTVDEGRQVLEAGRERGLGVRIHADELACTRATRLGLELGARSIDHVNVVHDDDLEALGGAEADVACATLCPVTPFTSTIPYAPARRLVDAGASLALGSDMNPNAWSEGMLLTLTLAVHGMRLTPSEALVAATVNAAWSLGLGDRGRLAPGQVGDAVVLDLPSHRYLGYRLGGAPVRHVVKSGRLVTAGTGEA